MNETAFKDEASQLMRIWHEQESNENSVSLLLSYIYWTIKYLYLIEEVPKIHEHTQQGSTCVKTERIYASKET